MKSYLRFRAGILFAVILFTAALAQDEDAELLHDFWRGHNADACLNLVRETVSLKVPDTNCVYDVPYVRQGFCKNNNRPNPHDLYSTHCESHYFASPPPVVGIHKTVCLPSTTNLVTMTRTGILDLDRTPWNSYCDWEHNFEIKFLNITSCKCDYISII